MKLNKLIERISNKRIQLLLLRLLYKIKRGKTLSDFRIYHEGRFYLYQVNNTYVPSESIGWFVDYDYYLKSFKGIAGWEYLPGEGDTVIDLGAGIGEEVLVLSKLVGPGGMVYAIEANPDVFEVLQDVVRLNALTNVKVFKLAISEESTQLKLSKTTSGFLGGSLNITDENHYYVVEGVRMDDFFEQQNIQKVALLKSNIEGAERFLINSIGRKIDLVKHVAISCHDFRYYENHDAFFKTKDEITAFLRANNFSVTMQQTGAAYIDDWVYGKNEIVKA